MFRKNKKENVENKKKTGFFSGLGKSVSNRMNNDYQLTKQSINGIKDLSKKKSDRLAEYKEFKERGFDFLDLLANWGIIDPDKDYSLKENVEEAFERKQEAQKKIKGIAYVMLFSILIIASVFVVPLAYSTYLGESNVLLFIASLLFVFGLFLHYLKWTWRHAVLKEEKFISFFKWIGLNIVDRYIERKADLVHREEG